MTNTNWAPSSDKDGLGCRGDKDKQSLVESHPTILSAPIANDIVRIRKKNGPIVAIIIKNYYTGNNSLRFRVRPLHSSSHINV